MIFTAPPQSTDSFVLDSNDPVIQQMVIDTLRKNDVAIYKGTTEFDPLYPFLTWDSKEGKLTQSRGIVDMDLYNLEEFMNKFQPDHHIHKLQLNDNYEAIIDLKEKTVKVGCQTFSFKTINALSELMEKEI